MKSIIMKNIAFVILVAATIMSCSKADNNDLENPVVHEEELITTVRLIISNPSGFNQTFDYKVDNGIGSADPSLPEVDDIILDANTTYNVEVKVLNEAETPVEDITEEVIAESASHLFLFASQPTAGPGAILFSNGSLDSNGEPFNQRIEFETQSVTNTGTTNGTLTVTLKHEPTNKAAINPDNAGGETDAVAIFPVKLQ